MTLQTAVTFLVPPVVGAGIGLFTNWLAIKMLFRPLAERRILGIRVPFTPGILPRERVRMAQSLGDTVATDLLDEATIAARLRSPLFKKAVKDAIVGGGRKALVAKPSDIASGIDPGFLSALKDAALGALAGVASSAPFSAAVEAGSASAIAAADGILLSDIVDHAAVSSLAAALSSPEASERIADAVSGAAMAAIQRAAAEGKSLSSLARVDGLVSVAGRVIDASYPALRGAVSGMLADKSVSASMEKAGARIMRRSLDRFNSVQRFFIGLGQYDKAILENMPATIADFSEAVTGILEEDGTRLAIRDKVGAAIRSVADKPLSGFGFLANPEAAESSRVALADALKAALSSLDRASIESFAEATLKGASVGAVLDSFPGCRDRLGPSLAAWIAGLFDSEPGADSAVGRVGASFFKAFSAGMKAGAADAPLGAIVDIDDRTLEGLALSASDGLTEMAAAESSGMLRSLDVRSLVVDKINTLDMIEVERMILKVVDKELGAITMFGGVLGAAIGIFQSLFMLLG